MLDPDGRLFKTSASGEAHLLMLILREPSGTAETSAVPGGPCRKPGHLGLVPTQAATGN